MEINAGSIVAITDAPAGLTEQIVDTNKCVSAAIYGFPGLRTARDAFLETDHSNKPGPGPMDALGVKSSAAPICIVTCD